MRLLHSLSTYLPCQPPSSRHAQSTHALAAGSTAGRSKSAGHQQVYVTKGMQMVDGGRSRLVLRQKGKILWQLS